MKRDRTIRWFVRACVWACICIALFLIESPSPAKAKLSPQKCQRHLNLAEPYTAHAAISPTPANGQFFLRDGHGL